MKTPPSSSTTLRKVSLIFLLIAAIALVKLPYQILEPKLNDYLKKYAEKNGFFLEAKDLQLSFPLELELEGVSAVFPADPIFLPLYVDNFFAKLSLSSLLFFKKSVSAKGELYRGTLAANFTQGMFDENITARLNLDNLELNEYPLTKNLGIFGRVFLKAKTKNEESHLGLKIKEAKYIGEHKIYGLVQLPVIEEIKLSLKANDKDLRTEISRLNLDSSVGTARGQGYFERGSAYQIESAETEIKIELNDIGETVFGGYLALAAGEDVETKGKNWLLSLEVQKNNSEIQVKKMPGA